MPDTPIVDSHVHLLPGRLALKVRAFFLDRITGDRLAYPLDDRVVLDRLAAAGVGTLWNLPYAHKPGVAAGLNASSAATVTELSDGPIEIIGGATAHPGDEDPAAVVREALDKYGLRVLKLHCSVGDFSPDDPRLVGMWQVVAERQMPVVIHLGHAVSGHTETHEVAPLERVAQAFPDAPIIIAHSGHPGGQAALALVEKYPSIYADLAPVVFEPVALPAEVVARLSHKILFGSDAPNTGLGVEECLAHVQSFGLNEEQTANILGGTARRLMAQVK